MDVKDFRIKISAILLHCKMNMSLQTIHNQTNQSTIFSSAPRRKVIR